MSCTFHNIGLAHDLQCSQAMTARRPVRVVVDAGLFSFGFFVVVLGAGCGTTVTPSAGDPPPTSSEPRPEDDGPPLGSTLGGSSGKSSGGSSSGEKPEKPGTGAGHGFVAVQTVQGEGSSAVAAFFDGPAGKSLGPDGCRVELHPDPSTPPDIGVSAGDVSITVGSAAIRLEFSPMDGYGRKPVDVDPIALDSTMGASALGATVPGFIAPMTPVAVPAITTATDTGIDSDAAFDASWQPIANATSILVKLDGDKKTVVCRAAPSATHFLVPAARVQEVAAQPKTLAGCSSCLTLTVTAVSEVEVAAGNYDVSLRHESSSSAALAIQ